MSVPHEEISNTVPLQPKRKYISFYINQYKMLNFPTMFYLSINEDEIISWALYYIYLGGGIQHAAWSLMLI